MLIVERLIARSFLSGYVPTQAAKPDAPLTPLDSTYLSDASSLDAPVIASTYSDFGGARTYYLFAYDRGANREASYKLSEIGLDRPAYLYDLMAGSGRLVEPEESLTETIAGGWLYRVVAPVGRSGIALLGDTGHFVSMGKKRVTHFSDDGIVRLTIAFAPAETSRTIRGYSPDPPAAWATTGSAGGAKYDAATHEFQVAVSPGPDGTASLLIARHRARIPESSTRPDGPIERRLPFRP